MLTVEGLYERIDKLAEQNPRFWRGYWSFLEILNRVKNLEPPVSNIACQQAVLRGLETLIASDERFAD